MRTSIVLLTVFSVILLSPVFVYADEPILYCKFDDTTTCEQGETPISTEWVSFETGKINSGVRIDTSDILSYPSTGNFNKEKGTVMMWVKTDWSGNNEEANYFFSYVDNGWTTDALRFRKYIEDTTLPNEKVIGILYYEAGGPDHGSLYYVNNSVWQAGVWYHIAATWDASTGSLKTYLNGVKREDFPYMLGTPFTLDPMINDEILIGVPYTYDFVPDNIHRLNGIMDELKIFDYALSDVEIMNEYLGNVPCQTQKLMEWTFDTDLEGWTASPQILDPPVRYCIWEDYSGEGYVGNPPGSILCASCLTSIPSDEFCTYDGCSEIHIEVTLPEGAETLTFETSGSWPLYGVNPLYDGGVTFKIKDETGTWHVLYDDCLAIDSSTWFLKSVDISSFDGQKVTLRFEQSEKNCGSGQVCNVEVRRIDNVIIWGKTPPCNCSELKQKIESLEGNLTELKDKVNSIESQTQENTEKIGTLEASISAIQNSISLLQKSLDAFTSLILGYLSNAPYLTKKSMVCGYMKDNGLTEYSALGLTCQIKGWSPGKPFLEWKHCICK